MFKGETIDYVAEKGHELDSAHGKCIKCDAAAIDLYEDAAYGGVRECTWGPAAVRQTASNVIQARLGGKVERCHNIPHQGSYSNAAHSWGVGMLMWYLWPEDFPRLGIYCLTHDVPEGIVGDIPAPTARYLPGLKDAREHVETQVNRSLSLPAEADLTGEDHAKVKACDRLEFWLWCQEQLAMGNTMVKDGLDEMERYFREVPLPERAQRLYEAMRERGVRPLWAGVMKELCE